MKRIYLFIVLKGMGLYAMEELPADEGQTVRTQHAAVLPVIVENRSWQKLHTEVTGHGEGVVFTISKTVPAPLQVVLYGKEPNGHEYPLAAIPFASAGSIQIPTQFLRLSRITLFRAHVPRQ